VLRGTYCGFGGEVNGFLGGDRRSQQAVLSNGRNRGRISKLRQNDFSVSILFDAILHQADMPVGYLGGQDWLPLD